MLYDKREILKVGTKDMKPRIFVSSTFYDLKSIREELYHFIRQYNYEPIESEMGDIGYVPGQELDKSCYNAMKDCDMAILIIGGRYGSPASGEEDENGDYVSVTHKEFRTAVNNGIPVYAFIEQAVNTEYELYKLNKERFSDPKFKFEFSSVDSINVFKFITELKSISGIPTVSFVKTQDIKDYLTVQWADMFKRYLEILRQGVAENAKKDTVDDIRQLTKRMDIMLDSIGKIILTENNVYAEVKNRQEVSEVAEIIASGICVERNDKLDIKQQLMNLLNLLKQLFTKDIFVTGYCYGYGEEDIKSKQMIEYFDQNGFEFVFLNYSEDEVKKINRSLASQKDIEILAEELCDPVRSKEIFLVI